ncbi:unnamed protein product [Heligmosomoides polygyrus]|uniref:Uncharacterized protein n=1 Tax=Heligmosomoides polygyrus TaxID=6339 RepID=A0A183GUT2_HELPZ|nr:unnamed protein product [Heligmosomoides polygyrus]
MSVADAVAVPGQEFELPTVEDNGDEKRASSEEKEKEKDEEVRTHLDTLISQTLQRCFAGRER